VLPGNARGALHRPFGEFRKIGGGYDTANAWHG